MALLIVMKQRIFSPEYLIDIGELSELSYVKESGDTLCIETHPIILEAMSFPEPVIAVVARSDATEWENIVDYPSERRPD